MIYTISDIVGVRAMLKNDKDVILKSLKDEENQEKLKERMVSLVNIFNLNL